MTEERQAVSRVDPAVEVVGPWTPIEGSVEGIVELLFVDGVRRIDARLTLDDALRGPISGICGSYGVGAVRWRIGIGSAYQDLAVQRLALLGGGARTEMPAVGGFDYRLESVATDDPGALVAHFHGRMRKAEAELAGRLAAGGGVVVADGPINELAAQPMVGYVKSHRVSYLPSEHLPVIARLRRGQRTPLFLIEAEAYTRYSWYLRLADLPGGHSWTAVVRCEAPAALGLAEAARLADLATGLLPRVASEPHLDPRAPQNLIPIAALERELRRRLGDPGVVFRALRSALAVREEVRA